MRPPTGHRPDGHQAALAQAACPTLQTCGHRPWASAAEGSTSRPGDASTQSHRRELRAAISEALRPGPCWPAGISAIDFATRFPWPRTGIIMGTVVNAPFGPPVDEVPLPRAPLTFVVAQARFERVASISSEEFIAGFQEKIRASYPVMQRGQQAGVLLGPEGQVVTADAGVLWRFDESPERWQVVLASDFVALSTRHYTHRRDFIDRFSTVLSAVQQELRIRFCDRIGIRYVDRVTGQRLLGRLESLLKPEVLGAVAVNVGEEGVENIHTFVDTTFRLPETAELHARWGLLPAGVTFDPAIEATNVRSWVLDLDAYSTQQVSFEPRTLAERTEALSQRIYRFFRWAVQDEFLIAHGGHL